MKRSLFVFLSCIFCATVWAQPKLYPLTRSLEKKDNSALRNVASTPFLSTLKLPFVHDFYTTYFPIDTIYNRSGSSSNPITCTTQRLHGLKDGDGINIEVNLDATVQSPALSASLEGTKYVKVLSKYTFEIYNDQALATMVPQTGDTLKYARINKIGSMITNIPDTLSFYNDQGGALVSPGYAKNPISYYCVTFDGLNEQGVPYNLTNALAKGNTDKLTSQPFNLKNYSPDNSSTFIDYLPSDSIYLSFFYQHAGFGDSPDLNDYLYLYFLDKNGVWNEVWSKEGTSDLATSGTFSYAMIPIKDPLYLHDAFQFKFQSYGRQSGSYDVWNVGNMYMNTGRTINNPFDHKDICISDFSKSILKDYTAMPYQHFFTNQTAFIVNELFVEFTNQSLDVTTVYPRFHLHDNLGNNSITTSNTESFPVPISRDSYSSPLVPSTLTNANKPLYITHDYVLEDNTLIDRNYKYQSSSNKNNLLLDFMSNNKITTGTTLYDYYAYDDNTAESAFGSNAAGSKIALQYKAEAMDTLTDIDIAFAQSKGGNLDGLKIYLKVWNSDKTIELRSQIITIDYVNAINCYTRYFLEEPLILQAGQVYHIGYQQNFNMLLTLGFDRNNDHTDKIFYSVSGGSWVNYSTQPAVVTGSLMMHPVFSKGEILLSIQDQPVLGQKKSLELYPNPASDQITVVSQDELSYKVFSLYGLLIDTGTLSIEKNNNVLSLQNYASGMYIIVGSDKNNNTYTARFIKE